LFGEKKKNPDVDGRVWQNPFDRPNKVHIWEQRGFFQGFFDRVFFGGNFFLASLYLGVSRISEACDKWVI
jgi:hypothetical protein